jgi:hypothetical protein
MDSIITGVIGVGIFLLFIGGLAQSIGHVPFTIIVIMVAAMGLYGLYEDIREDQKNRAE